MGGWGGEGFSVFSLLSLTSWIGFRSWVALKTKLLNLSSPPSWALLLFELPSQPHSHPLEIIQAPENSQALP